MPNLGPTEVIIILVLVILLFGAKKLPELGSSVGKSITNFKAGMKEAQDDEIDASTASSEKSTTNTTNTNTAKAPSDAS